MRDSVALLVGDPDRWEMERIEQGSGKDRRQRRSRQDIYHLTTNTSNISSCQNRTCPVASPG